MKHLRKFNESVSGDFPTDPDEIMRICRDLMIEGVDNIDSEGRVDVDADVVLHRCLVDGRLPIKFGRVTGFFIVESPVSFSGGKMKQTESGLTTFEGFPYHIGKHLYIRGNSLTDLKGCPEHVGSFIVADESLLLTSLDGLPKQIYGGLQFKNCPKLWDAKVLENVNFERASLVRPQEFMGSPVGDLIHEFAFGRNVQGTPNNINRFRDSLVFNYIRRPMVLPNGELIPTLNLFRFKEALDDAGILPIDVGAKNWRGLGRWIYVDDEGRRVDFRGDRI